MKFMISNYEYLEIDLKDLKIAESDQDYSNWCKDIDIEYVNTKENKRILFGYDGVRNFCSFFLKYEKAKKLMNNTHQLDKLIVYDLGFEWNEFFNDNLKSDKSFDYHWLSNSHKGIRPYYNSWLYNDKKGDVEFEITPFYPWYNVNKRTQPDRIPYKEWIKSYKPVVKTIIPKENFKQWIAQAEKMKQEYNL